MGTMENAVALINAEQLYFDAIKLTGDETVKLLNEHIAHNYSLLIDDPVINAEGCWLFTKSGRKLFDGVAAYSAANLGHNHPLVREMVMKVLTHNSPTVLGRFLPDPFLALLGKKITEMTGFDSFLPANGGVEAPEAAIKLARRWGNLVKKVPGTPEILLFDGCFHGRTLTVTQVFDKEPESYEGFGPFVEGFKKIPYGDTDALKSAINENTIAVMVEIVQGEGGINIPPDGYWMDIQKLAEENNFLVIYDEVQTGWGRTGKLFGWEHEGEENRPDIMCVGKSLSAGFAPISGILANNEIMELYTPGSHGSTFGGSPLSSAIAYAALNAIEMEKIPEQAAEKGAKIIPQLQAIGKKSKYIKEVRGMGLMIGIEFKQDGPDGHDFAMKLYDEGIVAKDTHKWVLRFTPPIVTSMEDLEWAVGRMENVFTQ
ncbi:MAG TPA: aspartate aminotransferase family protein [bacterium]|jgi:ornithine--oxo-acid transaminase